MLAKQRHDRVLGLWELLHTKILKESNSTPLKIKPVQTIEKINTDTGKIDLISTNPLAASQEIPLTCLRQ